MSLGVFNSAAFTTAGGLTFGAAATIEVRKEFDGQLATIFSDVNGTAQIAQPGFVADAQGRFKFYAAGVQSGYMITVTKAGGGESWTLRNVPIGTAQYLDAVSIWNATQQDRAARRARHFAALNYVF